ncbi:MAG: NHL repeat-containing protein [Treponema sp.]|nr:NHL repeat-containing protein [Treponema sp.]
MFTVAGNGQLILGSAASPYFITLTGPTGAAFISVTPSGSFTMNSGKLSGNTTLLNGAAVNNAGSFNMNGGEISANNAIGGTSKGGAVYNTGKFTMTGGTITGNTAILAGNGVYNDGIFEISGDALVDGTNDVYLPVGRTVTVTGNLNRPAAATITLNNADITLGRQILSGSAAGVNKGKFTFSTISPIWIDSYGKLSGYLVSTFAGTGNFGLISDGLGTSARFSYPTGIVTDIDGYMYVADRHAIRKISPNGLVTTLAGNGTSGFADGSGTSARFNCPEGVTVDSSGIVYIADTENHRIRKIDTTKPTTDPQYVTTIAGNATYGFLDGPGNLALFSHPHDIAVDKNGNVYVADTGNNRIRKIDTTKPQTDQEFVTTLAGSDWVWPDDSWMDGTADAARFSGPYAVAVDGSGNVYVADQSNYRVRKIDTKKSSTDLSFVTTLAGDGICDFADGSGTMARFGDLYGIMVDNAGNVYVTDNLYDNIRKITPQSYVTTIAGNDELYSNGWVDGLSAIAQFGYLQGITIDNAGNIYVAEYGNCLIRKIAPGPR